MVTNPMGGRYATGSTRSLGVLRTGWLYGVEHLIVPTIALVEGVLWSQNSPTPELVLAEDLRIAPQGWNSKPVVGMHPPGSASTPETLTRCAFGTVFNANVEGTKLVMEAWLNPARAHAVGPAAVRVIERVQSGELVDVSVGIFGVIEPEDGMFNGRAYHGKWTVIMPDHLAMLPEGTPGACSLDAGCGAPRRAAVYVS